MRINYQALASDVKQLIREGRDAEAVLREQFEGGVFKPADFRIREVAEATLGRGFVAACDPTSGVTLRAVMESDGVDSTAFSNITGQIVYTTILEAFMSPDLIGTSLIPTTSTRLSGEKLPGVSQIGDKGQVVKEGMPYENVGIGEEYVETPETDKRGLIVPVTKEAVFFDRTNLILQRASQVGQSIAIGKEKRILNAILGESSTFATGGKWKWKGTEYDVYNSTAVDFSSYFYVNLQTAVLQDYTDLDATENLFADMKDPTTQEPIIIPGTRTLLVVPNLRQTAKRIVNSTETRKVTSTSFTTLTPGDKGDYDIQSSPYFKTLLASNTTTSWWVGNFAKAFTYMENWPITVVQAPTNNEAEFTSDIVARYKASERGAVAVIAPHYVIKSTGAG
jgi:hypothetical protein